MMYLYAGLGVAMLTGIMAIFEMGLTLTGRSLLPSPPDFYSGSKDVKHEDLRMLKLMIEADDFDSPLTGTGASLCEQIFSAYSDAYVPTGGSNPWLMDPRMPVLTGPWAGSCLMNRRSHHIVVRPNPITASSPYELYSCILQGGNDHCSFEKN